VSSFLNLVEAITKVVVETGVGKRTTHTHTHTHTHNLLRPAARPKGQLMLVLVIQC
jgi:hypothetical protein